MFYPVPVQFRTMELLNSGHLLSTSVQMSGILVCAFSTHMLVIVILLYWDSV